MTRAPRQGAAHAAPQLLVLGPVRVRLADGSVLTPSAIARALLAALALAGESGVSSGALLATVWHGRHLDAPTSTLAVTVHRSRNWLADRVGEAVTIARSATGYLLRFDGGSSDVAEFRRLVDAAARDDAAMRAATLQRALLLWRGPALADVSEESKDTAAVDVLERERRAAVLECGLALLRIGDGARAVELLEPAARQRPLDSPEHAALIEALDASGRKPNNSAGTSERNGRRRDDPVGP